MPLMEIPRKDASLLAFSSISVSFIGVSICKIGKSDFPFMHRKMFCFVLKSSVFISTLIDSWTKLIKFYNCSQVIQASLFLHIAF